MEFAIASGVLAARAVKQAREKGDFSAASLSVYQNFWRRVLSSRTLRLSSMLRLSWIIPSFQPLSPALGDLFQSLIHRGEGPKKKLSATIREKIDWKEALSMLKDLRRGFKI